MKQTHGGGETPAPHATPLPDDFAVTDALYAYAAGKGISREAADAMTERFVLYWQTTPKDARKTDWGKAWQAWLLGDLASGKLTPQPDHITGRSQARRPEGGHPDADPRPDATDHGPFAFAVRGDRDPLSSEVDTED